MKTGKKKQGRPQPTNPSDSSHPSSDGLVLLSDLARQFDVDKSQARRYIRRLGYVPVKCRTKASGGQLCLAVTQADAERIVAQRKADGFLQAGQPLERRHDGFFYAIQPEPVIMPARIKLGIATDVPSRLATYRTIVPDAVCLKIWPCKATWECAAMDAMTREGCRHVAGEVYDCEDCAALVRRGDAFFRLMPGAELSAAQQSGAQQSGAKQTFSRG